MGLLLSILLFGCPEQVKSLDSKLESCFSS